MMHPNRLCSLPLLAIMMPWFFPVLAAVPAGQTEPSPASRHLHDAPLLLLCCVCCMAAGLPVCGFLCSWGALGAQSTAVALIIAGGAGV
jgi:hypothetical protein